MEFDLQGFSEAPMKEQVHRCTVAQLMSIAQHYYIEIAPSCIKKDDIFLL